MKKFLLLIVCLLTINVIFAQRYYTKTAQLSFDAGTGLEDIKGINKSSMTVIDVPTGQIQISTLIKGFEFESQLMQDHFNENYMESEKYPKSTFSGVIVNITNIDFKKNGTYTANVKGMLEIHGVKNPVETRAKFVVNGDNVNATCDFVIVLSQYKISIPSLVADKLSKTAKINVNCNYQPLK
jgi:hypothetical protein